MSKPQETTSQNSSEELELPKPEEIVVDYQSPALHKELASIFKTMVSKSTSIVKPSKVPMIENSSKQAPEDVSKSISESKELDIKVPTPSLKSTFATKLPPEVPTIENISDQPLEDVPKSIISESKQLHTKVATSSAVSQEKSRLRTSVVVAKQDITFQLPNPCIVDQIDMDKLPNVDRENNPTTVPKRRFSFKERLEGWRIEYRQRPNNAHDLFYHHSKSSRMFRSVPEVVKFLLYEIFPRHINIKKKKLIEDSDKGMPTSSTDQRSEEENLRNVVEEFYKDAYNNMINSTTKDYNDTE